MQLPFLFSPRQALVRALPWSHLRQLKLIYSGFGDAEAEVGAHPLRLLCLSRSVAASQKWRGRVLCGVLPDFRGRFFLRGAGFQLRVVRCRPTAGGV